MNLKAAAAAGGVAAASAVNALMKRRIFNEGSAVNSKIGRYRSRSYRAKRASKGRQTAYKDLELDGDLRRSIQTGKRKDGAVIGFTNDKAAAISTYQEEQTSKKIFKISKAELKAGREAFKKTYRAKLRT